MDFCLKLSLKLCQHEYLLNPSTKYFEILRIGAVDYIETNKYKIRKRDFFLHKIYISQTVLYQLKRGKYKCYK